MSEDQRNKEVILATRADDKSYEACIKELEKRFIKSNSKISKIYIVCNLNKIDFDIGGIPVAVIFDNDPIRPCAFNKVIERLNDDKETQHHLLTFSKEVELKNENIERMAELIDDKTIVVGYCFKDNILDDQEAKLYSIKDLQYSKAGIAYQVPWNTCALWNKKFIYGTKEEKLQFDEICENNQFGEFSVKVDGTFTNTKYKGMEDGLAIAELLANNSTQDFKYKLIKEELRWNIIGDEKRKKDT